jgi:16S rRNA (adenine1518-N6/adenine1519-N6)-dimethyltransferase
MSAPRKRFGQHFLKDAGVIEKIMAAIAPHPTDKVLEIGPGHGALTLPLMQRLAHLDVVEIDRDLVAELRARLASDLVNIHQGDVLGFDFSTIGRNLRIVGNLPYNISTPLLFRLSRQIDVVRDAHFMLQREVVERMSAQPGTASYGRLSVMLQYRWSMEALFDVSPMAFLPPPKVWSSIVRMIPLTTLPHVAEDESLFSDVVMLAFGQRRKTLRNSLRNLLGNPDFEKLGIDPMARGETLGVGEFVRIANLVSRNSAGRSGDFSTCAE